MKTILAVIVLLQCALMAYGFIQIQSESQFTVACGVFNIIANVVFGGMNVRTIIRF